MLINFFIIALSAQGGNPRFFKQNLLEKSQESLSNVSDKSQFMFENAEDLVRSTLGNIDYYIKYFNKTKWKVCKIKVKAEKFVKNSQILHGFNFDFENDETLRKMIVTNEEYRPFVKTAFDQELSNIKLQLINHNCFMELIKRFIEKFEKHKETIIYEPEQLLLRLHKAYNVLQEDTTKLQEKEYQTKRSRVAFNLICSTNNSQILQK